MQKIAVVITNKDCALCRFGSMCSGAALFETIPTLQSLMFDEDGCHRDWKSHKNLVEVLQNQSPAL